MLPLWSIIVILVNGLIFGLIFELIRRNQIRTEHGLLWLGGSGLILLSAIFGPDLSRLGDRIGLGNIPWPLLVIIGLLIGVAILFSQTIILSRLADHNRNLVQRLAISEWHLRQLESRFQDTETGESNNETI